MSENKFLDLKKVFQAGLQDIEEDSIHIIKEPDTAKEELNHLKVVAETPRNRRVNEGSSFDIEDERKTVNEDFENLEKKVIEFKTDWEKQQTELKLLISELRQAFIENKEDLIQTINEKPEQSLETIQAESEDIGNLERKVAEFRADWEGQQLELKRLMSEVRQSFIDNKEDLLQKINKSSGHSSGVTQADSEDLENLEKKVANFRTDWEKQQDELKHLIADLRQSFIDNKEDLIQTISEKPNQLIENLQTDLSNYEPEWIEKFQSSIHHLTKEIEAQHKEKLETQIFPMLERFQSKFFDQLENETKEWQEKTLEAVNEKISESGLQSSNLEELFIKIEALQANNDFFLRQNSSARNSGKAIETFDANFKVKQDQQLHDKLVEQNQVLEEKVDTLLEEIDTLKDVRPAPEKREKNNSLTKIVRAQSWLLISLFLLVGLSMSAFYSYIFNQYSNLVLILTGAIVLLGISLFIFVYQMVYSYKKPNTSTNKKQKR